MPSIDKIIDEVSKSFLIPVEEILSPERTAAIAKPRMVCYWLADFHDHSKASIARHMQRHDHSTIRSGISKINDLRLEEPDFRLKIEILLHHLSDKKRGVLEEDVPKPIGKPRPCICCGEEMLSTGSHHRMCQYCRTKTDYPSFKVAT